MEISNFFEEVIVPVLCPVCQHENSYSLVQVQNEDYLICQHCFNRIELRKDL
ncbi:MAG TPA: hypothetical protein PLC12_03200 [Candidatus Methanofastidiosa archaeon]|nr:hypothetical protein [Candidatus Methanofastidiosa archaeon]